ncbi:hypothetical protein E4U49_006802 [Claviceps purpurea]|nr:hypothetical protein E4U49_006802 [Claviceps purpurea]
MPLNPAFLGTATAFSGSLDVFSVQSHHQPNMSGNNNFSFFDAQPDQFAAVSTPEMEFPFMPSTTPADAHAMSDGAPLSGHFMTGSKISTSRYNYYVHWRKKRRPLSLGGTQASHALQCSTPTASSSLVDPTLQDETAPD